MAKTCGGSSPSDLPLYRLIDASEYKSLISLYGFSAIKMFATYVCKTKELKATESDKIISFDISYKIQQQNTHINFIFKISCF